jgi:hypothetical protein
MFTHALLPGELLDTLRARLRPGGALYLHLENDDARMHERRKNLVGELKCFHFQNCDGPTRERCLRARGLVPETIGHAHASKSSLAVLSRAGEPGAFEPMSEAEREERIARYARWHDHSILSLPEPARGAFGGRVRGARRRALREGYAQRKGLRGFELEHQLRVMHGDGYAELNEKRRAEPTRKAAASSG